MTRPELDDPTLEGALGAIGRSLAYTPPADLRRLVLARLAGAPAPRTPWWERISLPRQGLRPALAAVAVVLLVLVLTVPAVRTAAGEILHIGGIDIFRAPVPSAPAPTAPARPSPSATIPPSPTPLFGVAVTLDEARARAGYPLSVPTDQILGLPDEVYLRTLRAGAMQVTLVYRQRAGIPVSPFAGVSAVVVFLPGALDPGVLGKVAGPGTTIETLTVNGGPGAWLSGQPHQIFYRSGAGFETDELRLAGNTLMWQQGLTTVRIEAAVDQATALRIAATMRP
ncbi:MAG: hypothetical protein NVS9B6_08290 [Candidatus Limnocylindrales bacterium]